MAGDEFPPGFQATIDNLQGQLMRRVTEIRDLKFRLAEAQEENHDLKNRIRSLEADNETLEAMVWDEKDG